MADSLSSDCTPLKKAYDGCFNKWFQEYMQTFEGRNGASDLESAKAKGLELDGRCGASFATYRNCIQVALEDRGINELLEEARREDPYSVPS